MLFIFFPIVINYINNLSDCMGKLKIILKLTFLVGDSYSIVTAKIFQRIIFIKSMAQLLRSHNALSPSKNFHPGKNTLSLALKPSHKLLI